MRRGGRLGEQRRLLKAHVEEAISGQGVPPRIAARVAFQLILKVPPAELGDVRVWSAIGSRLNEEVVRLQEGLHLTERLIRVGVPKMSADEIEALFKEMHAVDARYGRTLAEAALDGAEPRAMATRYARAFTESAKRLTTKNPRIARTLAAAAFRSSHPLGQALEYLRRFETLVGEFDDDVTFARTVAKAAFVSPDPIRAARQFVRDYRSVVRDLADQGVEPTIARSLAGIASLCGEPLHMARTLVAKFQEIETMVKRTHPQVARSVALAACRATDAPSTARLYVANYDRIIEVIGKVDPQRARKVASQAFRSDNPIAWARRFHHAITSPNG